MASAEPANYPQPKHAPVEYPNLLSRLLLSGYFQRQFIIPENPPRLLELFLTLVERGLLRVDLTGIEVKKPIFLLGLPRSGTTMLQDLFCTHPEVAYITNTMHQFPRCFCAAETLRKFFKLDGKVERYLGDSVEVQAGSAIEGLKFWGFWFGWDPHNVRYVPRAPDSFQLREIQEIHDYIRRIIWCFGRGRRFFNKNPALIPDIALLKHLFPDAKFIHIVRDPRNSANSLLKLYRLDRQQLELVRTNRKHGLYDRGVFIPYPRVPKLADYLDEWGPDDLRTTSHVWDDAISIVREWSPKLDNFYQVRYEDILREPAQHITRLLEFAELSPVAPDNQAFREKLANVGTIHHTNRYGDFEVIEEICRDNMRALGYDSAATP